MTAGPDPGDPRGRLALALRRARIERGMHQTQMAALLGMDPSAVCRIERSERRNPRLDLGRGGAS